MEQKQRKNASSQWEELFMQKRIDTYWLNYNPHAFLPLDFDTFVKTGGYSKLHMSLSQQPSELKTVFIVGCGRSGSSLLGKLLSAHPKILFLNEPREVWMQAFPEFDVWSVKAKDRGGKLKLSESHACTYRTSQLTSILKTIASKVGKSVLLEKTPENAFRLEWLYQMFPNSKFIYFKRDALSTARSISRFQPSLWYGFKDEYKWKQIASLIPEFQNQVSFSEEFVDLANRSDEYLAKGLVEWGLSLLSARRFAEKLTHEERKKHYMEVSYEDLLLEPKQVLGLLLKFLELESEQEVMQLAEDLIQPYQSPASPLRRSCSLRDLSEEDLLSMAGDEFMRLICS